MAHNPVSLEECNNLLLQQTFKRHGFSATDAKHIIFIQEKQGWYGFKSFLDLDIASNVREIKIILNGWMIDSRAIRSRLKAYLEYANGPDEELLFPNHIGAAIRKLARYGIHIRDKHEG